MAASADQKTELSGLYEKFLTCEVCKDCYKKPKNLPCGHTFCQECLEKWAKAIRANKPTCLYNNQELTCPHCREPWQLPLGGIEKLPTNYHLKSLIEFHVESEEANKTNNGDSKMCELCDSKAATSACLECPQLICDDCAKGHQRMRATAGHRVVSLEDYRTKYEKQPARMKIKECDRHPGIELEFFCQTCSVPICMKCTIADHRVPEHQHVNLSEAARDSRVSINKTSKELLDKLKYYDENKTNIELVKKGLIQFRAKTALEVEKHMEILLTKIQENGKEIIKEMDKIYDAKLNVLDSQIDRIERAMGQVNSSLDYSKNLVELGTDAGLMLVNKQTQEMLEGFLNEEIQVKPQVNYHLQYIPNTAFENDYQGSIVDGKAVACQSIVKCRRPYAMIKSNALFQLVTNDVHGNEVRQGGAKVMAEVTTESGERVVSEVIDNNSGTYDITFTPTKPGTHRLSVSLFGQPVKDSPIKIEISSLPFQTTRMIGSLGSGPGQFNRPTGLAMSKVNDIYVADNGNWRIQVFDSHGKYQRHFSFACSGKKVKPHDVAFTREDHLVITDVHGKQVCVCDTDGKLLRRFGKGELREPEGVAVGSDGCIHVADSFISSNCVKTFTPEGELVRTIGEQGDQPGQFKFPRNVAVNSKDQIIVSDWGNHRVQVFDSSGAFLFTCGKKGEGAGDLRHLLYNPALTTFLYEGQGKGELQNPCGVTVDQADNIIVCDRDCHRVQMFNPEGGYIGRVDDPNEGGVNEPRAITAVPGQPLQLIVTEFRNNRLKVMQVV